MSELDHLPVAVIGAGPVGLAAAAELIARGIETRVYEAGPEVADNVRDWGHVRLFSPWRYNVAEAASRLLVEVCGARLVPGTIDVASEIPERHRVAVGGGGARARGRGGGGAAGRAGGGEGGGVGVVRDGGG